MKFPPTLSTETFTGGLRKFSTIIVLMLIAFAGAEAACQAVTDTNVPSQTVTSTNVASLAPANTHLVFRNLFGLSMTAGVVSREPWPVVSFGGVHVYGDATWAEINSSTGVYDWSLLDKWLAAAHKHNQDVLYTFSAVPRWVSSNPYNTLCHGGIGTCSPPYDLATDGTGTDQMWKDFVAALATHSKNSTTAHIKFWEMWNEPANAFFWDATPRQMVRMAADARAIIKSIDPTAVVLTPALTWNTKQALTWDADYLAAGGGKYADIISVHGYVFAISSTGVRSDDPEHLLALMGPFKTMLATYGQQYKPLYNTESSWGLTSIWDFTNADMQAAFVARMYLLNAAYGISRLYWFQWNNVLDGTLWLANPTNPTLPGTLLKPGVAYNQIYKWLAGRYIANSCTINGSIWSCSVTGANGYLAQAIWDTSETCTSTGCQIYEYPIDATKYHYYQTLSGSKVTITGSTVPIGAKPILVENQ